jgi:hypothetical protein
MWKQEDTSLLRDYNAKAKGKLIEFLKSQCPPVLGTSIEEVALEAKFKQGYERAVDIIVELVKAQEEESDGGTKHAQM